MQPAHRFPVKVFPDPLAVVQAEKQQGQNSVIDAIEIRFHVVEISRNLAAELLGLAQKLASSIDRS